MSIDDFSKGMRLTRLHLDACFDGLSPDRLDPWLQEIRGQVQQNDEVYHYSSEPSFWELGMGSEGYVIVRNGQIVASIVKRMN
jgi:hypothetical protein